MLSVVKDTIRKGKQMLDVRTVAVLVFYGVCATAVELMALYKGVNGTGLTAYFVAGGAVMGGAGVKVWQKLKRPKP